MEGVFAVVVGVFFAVAIYLMLAKNIIRILIGVVVFGNAVNLFIFTAGRLTAAAPPILAAGGAAPETPTLAGDLAPVASDAAGLAVANPLPQALILTAIVISFSLFAFLLVLAFRAYEVLGTDEVDEMRLAEPPARLPPLGY